MNKKKTKLYLYNSCPNKEELYKDLGSLLTNYQLNIWGLPLVTSKLKDSHCSTLLEKVQKQLEVWQWRLLLFSGRLEYLRSIIFSYQYYWSVAFQLFMKTILKIERMIAIFLGRRHPLN